MSTPVDNEKTLGPYKVIVVGDVGCGKTSIIKLTTYKVFSDPYKATIGVDFATKSTLWEGRKVALQLWDVAGQERYGNMTRVYYKEADAAFVVFDRTRKETFEAVAKWKDDLDKKIPALDGVSIPMVLLGNKCDLAPGPFMTTREEQEKYIQEKNFQAFYETSAKENIGIEQAITFIVQRILANRPHEDQQETPSGSPTQYEGFPLANGTKSGPTNSCRC